MITKIGCYGTLMKGFHNHVLLEQPDVTFLGNTKTEPKFTMYSLGSFPAITLEGNDAIEIEVYDIKNENILKRIDVLEGYKANYKYNFYNKIAISTEFGAVYIYIIDDIKLYSTVKTNTNNWKDYAKKISRNR